jgi:deoxyribodipyrimidine photolyase-like uncharacterized protein
MPFPPTNSFGCWWDLTNNTQFFPVVKWLIGWRESPGQVAGARLLDMRINQIKDMLDDQIPLKNFFWPPESSKMRIRQVLAMNNSNI